MQVVGLNILTKISYLRNGEQQLLILISLQQDSRHIYNRRAGLYLLSTQTGLIGDDTPSVVTTKYDGIIDSGIDIGQPLRIGK